MGKKGKGRQSGQFGSKSERAAHMMEWKTQLSEVRKSSSLRNLSRNVVSSQSMKTTITRTTTTTTSLNGLTEQRPKLTQLGHLRSLLRERQAQESYERTQRRRRDGFLPVQETAVAVDLAKLVVNPPGWLLQYGKSPSSSHSHAVMETASDDETTTISMSKSVENTVSSLNSICLDVFSTYIHKYLESMGKEELHAVLAMLPSDTLSELSISVSQKHGLTDDLVYIIGKHSHAEELCIRATPGGSNHHQSNDTVSDQGLLELLPRFPTKEESGSHVVVDSWEDLLDENPSDDDYDNDNNDDYDDNNKKNNPSKLHQPKHFHYDLLQLEGCSIRLKRLELLDCLYISADTVLTLLQKCPGITHLSLAGSIQSGHVEDAINAAATTSSSGGKKVLLAIPKLLPSLQVLDVTRCNWMIDFGDEEIMEYFQKSYHVIRDHCPPPKIYCDSYHYVSYNEF